MLGHSPAPPGSRSLFSRGSSDPRLPQLLRQTLAEGKKADAKFSEIGEALLANQPGKRQAAGAGYWTGWGNSSG
jgi:hypothetical protein